MDKNEFIKKAKEDMKNNPPSHGWRISNFGEGPRCFYLDNGDNTFVRMEFYKRPETDVEIIEMARAVAEELGIECRI